MAKQKGHTTIYKTLHRSITSEQHEPHQQPGLNTGAMEG